MDKMTYISEILNYAQQGNAIFPCRANAKAPLLNKGEDWKTAATTDATKIQQWWSANPNAWVGRPERGDELTVDVDGDVGFDSLKTLCGADESLAAAFKNTLCIETVSGGAHFKFMNSAHWDFANAVGAWPGIDLRVGGKGYAIVPPSPGYTLAADKARQPVPESFWRAYCKQKKAPGPDAQRKTVQDADADAQFIPEGKRDDTLFRTAAKMHRDGYGADVITGALLAVNQRCQPPLPEAQVLAKVASAMKYDASSDETALVESLENFEAESFTYVLSPLVALQEVTMLTGDGGQGKGLFTCMLAAHVSKGSMSAIGASDLAEAAGVLFFNREDLPGKVLRPRLEAHGADLSRIKLVRQSTSGKGFDFGKVRLFEDAIAKHRPTLVIIDNVSTFSQRGTDSDNQAQVVRELEPIAELARKYDCAILIVHHHNKKGGIMGSVGYQTIVRNVITMEEQSESERIINHVKSNIGKRSVPLLFDIIDTTIFGGLEVARMVYRGKAESVGRSGKLTKQQRCTDWLRALLAAGPVPNMEVVAQSKQEGFNAEELKRAKTKLAVVALERNGAQHLGTILDAVPFPQDNNNSA